MMLKFLVTSILLSGLLAQKQIDEWQTGVDFTINNNQKPLSGKDNILSLTQKIDFPKKFSQEPKVVLSYEQIEFKNQRQVDFQVSPSDITTTDFKIRYLVRGPIDLKRLKVRWVAFMDPLVEVQELEFRQLMNLGYGTGKRVEEFPIPFKLVHFGKTQIALFLSGLLITSDDQSPFALELNVINQEAKGFTLQANAKQSSRIRNLRVFAVISSDTFNILQMTGTTAGAQNRFNDRTINGLRHQTHKQQVDEAYFKPNGLNILFQGIRGFEVDSQTEYFSIGLDRPYISNSQYVLSYGPYGNSIVQAMQTSYLLHPALVIDIKKHVLVHQQKKKGKKSASNAHKNNKKEKKLKKIH